MLLRLRVLVVSFGQQPFRVQPLRCFLTALLSSEVQSKAKRALLQRECIRELSDWTSAVGFVPLPLCAALHRRVS